MNLNAITLAITRPGRVRSWDPLSLFTGSTVGAWYDPSDYSTLFQNAAGTLPVTAVEQPVGLMLDKSKGLVLGPELVTNEDFSNGTTGWTAGPNNTISVVSGQLKCVSSQTDGAYFGQPFAVESGKTYKFVYQAFSDGTSQAPGAALGTSLGSENRSGVVADGGYGFGSRSFVYRATASETLWLWFYGGASKGVGNYILIDNISVRELPGNHAFNASGNSANFPVLSARYNLLTKTEDLSDVAWTKNAATPSATKYTDPNGNISAYLISEQALSNTHYVASSQASVVSGTSYTFSIYLKKGTGSTSPDVIQLSFGTGGFSSDVYVNFNITSSIVSSKGSAVTGASIESVGNGWYRCSMVASASSSSNTTLNVFFVNNNASATRAPVYIGATTSDVYIWGADFRVANDALNQPAYQRVNTSSDYDTVGSKPYLKFNGTNQWLQTNSIDFTYGDKMFVSAGARKIGSGVIIESSQSTDLNNGSFHLYTAGTTSYQVLSKGTTAQQVTPTASATPSTDVATGLYNISAPSVSGRVNGVAGTPNTSSQGTGNYGNYPMFLGARAGTSLWFNGRLYGMVVAGKQASAAEITSTETYLNNKTGAF